MELQILSNGSGCGGGVRVEVVLTLAKGGWVWLSLTIREKTNRKLSCIFYGTCNGKGKRREERKNLLKRLS